MPNGGRCLRWEVVNNILQHLMDDWQLEEEKLGVYSIILL